MFGTDRQQTGGRPMGGPSRRGVAMLLALCGAAIGLLLHSPARAQSPIQSATIPASMVAKVVAGIVSYTRWPGAAPSIRLCTIGHGPGVDALRHVSDLGSTGRTVEVVPMASVNAAGSGCDAVYLGRTKEAEARNAVRLFAGRPVLLLGEGPEFCSDGGMFCVEPAAAVPRFGVNLDAVARSGLRVNPQVLRIARGSEGLGS